MFVSKTILDERMSLLKIAYEVSLDEAPGWELCLSVDFAANSGLHRLQLDPMFNGRRFQPRTCCSSSHRQRLSSSHEGDPHPIVHTTEYKAC